MPVLNDPIIDEPRPETEAEDEIAEREREPFFNLSYYSNPALDSDIDQASVVAATDRDQATQMYGDMQQVLFDDAPAIPLYTQVYQRAMLSSVDGFVDNPAYPNVVFGYELTSAA